MRKYLFAAAFLASLLSLSTLALAENLAQARAETQPCADQAQTIMNYLSGLSAQQDTTGTLAFEIKVHSDEAQFKIDNPKNPKGINNLPVTFRRTITPANEIIYSDLTRSANIKLMRARKETLVNFIVDDLILYAAAPKSVSNAMIQKENSRSQAMTQEETLKKQALQFIEKGTPIKLLARKEARAFMLPSRLNHEFNSANQMELSVQRTDQAPGSGTYAIDPASCMVTHGQLNLKPVTGQANKVNLVYDVKFESVQVGAEGITLNVPKTLILISNWDLSGANGFFAGLAGKGGPDSHRTNFEFTLLK